MVDDPCNLLGMQAWIDRMQHAARAGHREVKLHVPVAVPGKRRDAVAARDAEGTERVGHLSCAAMEGAIRSVVNIAFDSARYDLGVAVMPLRMLDQRRDQQRHLHHQAVQH